MSAFTDKELPYSLEAEQTILGAILIDPDVLTTVVEKIKPESFFNEQHRELFHIIMRLFTTGAKVDIVVVLNEAMSMQIFETAKEGRKYLASLVELVPSVANIESYCDIVSEKYYIRSLAYVAKELLGEITSGNNDAQLLLDAAEQKIFDIRQGKDVRGLVPRDVIVEAYDHIGKIAGPDGKIHRRQNRLYAAGLHHLGTQQVRPDPVGGTSCDG